MDLRTGTRVVTNGAVAADHPAQVTAPVSGRVLRRLREPADSHQLVVDGEEWSLQRTRLGPRHMLPATLGQETVITAANKLGAALQDDPIGRLYRGPLRQDGGERVPAIVAFADRAVDIIPDPDLGDRLRAAVCHQDRRLTADAINTRMLAAPVGVDGPAERHPGRLGDAVDHGLGLDLVEGHAPEARGVEGAGHRPALDERERHVPALGREQRLVGRGVLVGGELIVQPQMVPAHEPHDRTVFRSRQT